MKTKKGFKLRSVANISVLVATEEAAKWFNGYVELNSSGAYLWQLLEKDTNEATLVQALLDKYDIDRERAAEDVKTFLNTLEEASILE